MFDWFRRPAYTEQTTATDDMLGTPYIPFPKVAPTPPEPNPVTLYAIGPTEDNRLTLKVGYTTLTMNKSATQSLISHLQAAMDGLYDNDSEE